MLRWTMMLSLIAVLSAQPVLASTSINTKSHKYAALVMDADTGEVFYSRNADSKRYPASLTKMMTLYMLFEALRDGRMTLQTQLPVSGYAASQPQTNISLRAGESIKVEDAIKALVVRSANDVSVVIAEALGKSEWNFALNMTAKARSLGMRRTQFRNPHGLPDRDQFSSARDIAKLSVALRRDFPQYYDFFTTDQFTWKGTTYKSHNRVMGKFDGVDGIKTGYINMSGFNLATSVKRDGYHIVSVVMGGQTGAIRDEHMLSLLDRTFAKLQERGDAPRAFANAPLPIAKPLIRNIVNARADSDVQAKAVQLASRSDKQIAESSAAVQALRDVAQKEAPKDDKPVNSFRFVSGKDIESVKEQNTLNFQLASLNTSSPPRYKEGWGIQVGAFNDESAAVVAATNAVKLAKNYLKYSTVSITDKGVRNTSVHRARLANLTEHQARSACAALSEKNRPCFVFRAENNQSL